MTHRLSRFDYATGQLATGGVAEQADQALRNVADALAQAGARMEDVVRVRYILPRRDLFPATWPVLRRWFGDVRPAATMIEAGLMEEAMLFEVEATARKASSTGPGQARTEGRAEGDATAAVSLP